MPHRTVIAHRLLLAIACAGVLALAHPALLAATTRESAANDSRQPALKEWQKTLDATDQALTQPDITDPRLVELRAELIQLEQLMRQFRDGAKGQSELLRRDLEALGPPPEEGAPPEAPNLVERRKHLNEQIAVAEGAAKETELLLGRAGRSVDSIKEVRLSRFTTRVLTRTQSALNPALWSKAAPDWGSFWTNLTTPVKAWVSSLESDPAARDLAMRLALGIFLALVLAFPARLWLARRLARNLPAGPPSDLQRVLAAAANGFLHAWLPSMAAIALYATLTLGEHLDPDAASLAQDGLSAAILVFFINSFSASALRPQRAVLRLAPLADDAARIITRVVKTLTWLFALDYLLGELVARQDVSVEFIATQQLGFGLLVTLTLTGLLTPRVWTASGGQASGLKSSQRHLRIALILLVILIPLSAAAGYLALSRLFATHWVLTVGLLALLALLTRIGQELTAQLVSVDSRAGLYLRRQLALSDEAAEMLGFWLAVGWRTGVWLAGALALLLLWSVDRKDVLLWLEQSYQGFKLGGITISPADILLGLLLFTALLAATRLLQRTLDRQIFPRTRLDSGLRHSIRSALGYAGLALALILGVSTMGVDLSKLAIIAGALSVGIGFGLQNIVNNFVSGLILLVERPIKTGDWVVVGEHQGHVRKISVRATEITTFDRASVFIPNSSLISGAVMNRTHADKVGRILLPIGIAYDSDPNLAKKLLLDIAEANPGVRPSPSPMVFMAGFGDSAINLEFIAFVHDVDKVKSVASELCFAIFKTFREHGIQIPYPQRDMHITLDDEQLRRVLATRHAT